MSDVKAMRLGPQHPSEWWQAHTPDGDCKQCGGQCGFKDCGIHPAGCLFGGFGEGYWMIVDGCPLFHGE